MQDSSEDQAASAAVPVNPFSSERSPTPFPAQAQGDDGRAVTGADHAAGQQAAVGERAAGRAPAVVRSTGDPRVDAAVAALDGLAGAPPEEHVAVFESIHGKLREVLSELDSGPSGPAGAAGR